MLLPYVFGAMGGGDVKLFAALGTFLGPWPTVQAFLYTLLAGGVLAVVVALQRRRLQETMHNAAALVASGGANARGDRAPDEQQPVRICASHRGRNVGGGARVLR